MTICRCLDCLSWATDAKVLLQDSKLPENRPQVRFCRIPSILTHDDILTGHQYIPVICLWFTLNNKQKNTMGKKNIVFIARSDLMGHRRIVLSARELPSTFLKGAGCRELVRRWPRLMIVSTKIENYQVRRWRGGLWSVCNWCQRSAAAEWEEAQAEEMELWWNSNNTNWTSNNTWRIS